MQDRPRIGFILGNDTDRAILFDQDGGILLMGNNDADRVFGLLEGEAFNWARLHFTPSYFRKARHWDVSKVDVLWNMVSDADQNPETLSVIEKFTRGLDIPIIDPAAAIKQTRRHHISARLAGLENVVMPKTLLLRNPSLERVKRQLEEADFRFPAIVRRTGSHNGEFLGLFESAEAIEGCYGDRRNEYYITEFVDVRAADGIYRKTRFFFVGEAIVLRQHILADVWNIHGNTSRRFMVNHPEMVEESRAALLGGFDAQPEITRTALRAIRDRIGLDYFGIDVCVQADGRLVVFEANATMNFNPFFRNPAMQHNRAAVAPMVAAVTELLHAKLAQRASRI
ncbi:ATP-grasp domain-containing protein [Phenylobacterium sp.]|uniref:ATP-grasp domain-containing protein n=1 Tax=Phenylobacterium sp. TaxID=1871053 RepID=UPI003BA9C17A